MEGATEETNDLSNIFTKKVINYIHANITAHELRNNQHKFAIQHLLALMPTKTRPQKYLCFW